MVSRCQAYHLAGAPAYGPGGLLVDLGLLKLTDKAKAAALGVDDRGIYKFAPSSQTVIEWRAITVIALYVWLAVTNSRTWRRN